VTRAFSFTKTPKRVLQRAFLANGSADDRSPGADLDCMSRMSSSSTLAMSRSASTFSLTGSIKSAVVQRSNSLDPAPRPRVPWASLWLHAESCWHPQRRSTEYLAPHGGRPSSRSFRYGSFSIHDQLVLSFREEVSHLQSIHDSPVLNRTNHYAGHELAQSSDSSAMNLMTQDPQHCQDGVNLKLHNDDPMQTEVARGSKE
ncbi:hypothetical protein DNTS_024912, partial [Danionella cerebrum]